MTGKSMTENRFRDAMLPVDSVGDCIQAFLGTYSKDGDNASTSTNVNTNIDASENVIGSVDSGVTDVDVSSFEVSPINAPLGLLQHMPPLFLQVSNTEILRDDSVVFMQRLSQARQIPSPSSPSPLSSSSFTPSPPLSSSMRSLGGNTSMNGDDISKQHANTHTDNVTMNTQHNHTRQSFESDAYTKLDAGVIESGDDKLCVWNDQLHTFQYFLGFLPEAQVSLDMANAYMSKNLQVQSESGSDRFI